MLLRVGQIALGELQPERAMKAIERVLEDEPGNYEARDAAERLLEIGSVRIRASRSLETVYEAQDEIRDLVRVLSVRVEALRPDPEQSLSAKELAESESERRDLLRLNPLRSRTIDCTTTKALSRSSRSWLRWIRTIWIYASG